MKIASNAIVFKAKLPSAEAMQEHLLKSLNHEPIGEYEAMRIRMVETPHGDVVTKLPNGYAFTLLIEKRAVPGDVLKKAVQARVDELEETRGKRITNKERGILREEELINLLPQAFVRATPVTCYYHANTSFLVVPVASRKAAQNLVGTLVHAVEAIETTTIHVSGMKRGLTARIQKELTDGDAFSGFELGDYLELRSEGEKEVYDRLDLAASEEGILHSISCGMNAKVLELRRDPVTFRLTEDFHFKRIEVEYELDEDEEEVWVCNAAPWLEHFAATVQAVCDLVGYKEEAAEA